MPTIEFYGGPYDGLCDYIPTVKMYTHCRVIIQTGPPYVDAPRMEYHLYLHLGKLSRDNNPIMHYEGFKYEPI